MKKDKYQDFLTQLQERVNSYGVMLEERKKVLNEFTELTNLLNELRKKKNELINKYNIIPTPSLKNKIEECNTKEVEYLELINECAKRINELSIANNYEKDKEFLDIARQFYRINTRLKEIERLSKKLKDKSTQSMVQVINIYGRKKYIDSSLLFEYQEFLKIARVVFPSYYKGYREYTDRYNIEVNNNMRYNNMSV